MARRKLRSAIELVKTRHVVDTPALYREVGRRIRVARERAGLSQGQLGIALGMTRANVSLLESGGQRVLLEHVYNAALFLDRPAREFLP